MAEQEQNRTEPATPFKLREARRRGQVVKSLEVNSLLLLSALLALLYFRLHGYAGKKSGELHLPLELLQQFFLKEIPPLESAQRIQQVVIDVLIIVD